MKFSLMEVSFGWSQPPRAQIGCSVTQEAVRSVGQRQDTYRQDGDDDPHGAEHSVVYGLTDFQGVLDALIVAVKPTMVRLNGACLDDEEGQSRWGNTHEGKGREERRSVKGVEGEHPTAETTPNVAQKCYSNSYICGILRPLRSFRNLFPCLPIHHPRENGFPLLFLSLECSKRGSGGVGKGVFHTLLKVKARFLRRSNATQDCCVRLGVQGDVFWAPTTSTLRSSSEGHACSTQLCRHQSQRTWS